MPEAAGATANPVIWSEEAAEEFLASIAAERKALARQRFAGADPAVKGPSGVRGNRTVARILAADRDGAFVQTGAGPINPAEDRAEEALQHAIAALGSWGFSTVQRELAIAAATARTPIRQQRIGVIRAIAALVRAIVHTPPGDRIRGEDRSARSLIAQADQLAADERAYYQTEIDRLRGAWRDAASDDTGWQAWAILRGRLALRDGADESAMAWALRAWQRQDESDRQPTDPPLAALLDQARATFQAIADPAVTELPPMPRASDVLNAVAAALAERRGASEPFAPTLRFSFVPYHPPRPDAEHEVAT